MSNRQRMFSEEEVERAVEFLRDSAPAVGEARARMVRADAMVSHIEALLMTRSEAPSDMKRKAEARASERYLAAINEHAMAVGEFKKLKSQREAASMKIGAWRTECSNYRSIWV